MQKQLSRIQAFAPLPLGDRIREFRKRRGWNQAQFAEVAGVTQAQVSRWESGVDRPSPSSIATIARHADDSERSIWLAEAGLAAYVRDEDAEIREIPVLKDAAAAGSARAVDGNSIDLTLTFPRRWLPKGGSLFGLKVKGDSMAPTVNDGNLVIVDVASRDPYSLVGAMVAARDGDGVTIKWLRQDEGVFFLVPQHTSERHPIRLLKNDGNWSIIGEVIKIIGDPPPRKRK